MKKEKKTLTWVHPDFHQKLKIGSAEHGMSMIKYTERLAKDMEDNEKEKKKMRTNNWEFGF